MIAAAGSGERLGAGGPKALVEVAGRPLLGWSVAAFAAAPSVTSAVIAAPAGFEAQVEEAASAGELPVRVVAGGATRAESVAAALAEVRSELVAVHDAARPLLTPELIERLVAALAERADADGVIAASPIADTVKRVREGEIASTESREGLWSAQTPQLFRTEALRRANAADPERVRAATDDAMLIEAAGGTVLVEPSGGPNLKVTTPADLRLAETLLRG